jgi:hypothetical protein
VEDFDKAGFPVKTIATIIGLTMEEVIATP